MPVIFLLSGIVSGIALIMVIYVLISKIRGEDINLACIETLAGQLLLFLIIDISLELLELVHILYLQEEGIEVILGLITDKLFVSYIIVQIGLGGLLPIAMLGAGKISKSAGLKRAVYTLSSVLVLIGVFANEVERYNRRTADLKEPERFRILPYSNLWPGRSARIHCSTDIPICGTVGADQNIPYKQ